MDILKMIEDPDFKAAAESAKEAAIARLIAAKKASDKANQDVADADKAVARICKLIEAIEYYEVPF